MIATFLGGPMAGEMRVDLAPPELRFSVPVCSECQQWTGAVVDALYLRREAGLMFVTYDYQDEEDP